MKNNVFSKIFERSAEYIAVINLLIIVCVLISPVFIGAGQLIGSCDFDTNTINTCCYIEGMLFAMIISLGGMLYGDKISNTTLSAAVIAMSICVGVGILMLFLDGIIPTTPLVAIILGIINVCVIGGRIYWLKIR